MFNTLAVYYNFICPVNAFNTITTVQFNIIFLFFFITHLYQIIPGQCAGNIIGQQHTVIKRKILFTENFYLIFRIQCPVTFYKPTCTGACANHNNFLFRFFMPPHLYSTKFKIRFLTFWINQVIGKIICPVQITV